MVASLLILSGCSSSAKTLPDEPAAPFSPASATPTMGKGGVAELPGEEILRRARAALLAQRSVRITGGDASEHVDIRVGARGSVAQGSMSIEGDTLTVTRIGQSLWLGADAGMWRLLGLEAAADRLAGRFVKFPAGSGNLEEIVKYTELSGLASLMLDPKGGAVTKVPAQQVRTTKAIGLVLAGQDRRAVYVATTGQPLPVRLVLRYPSTASYDLVDYNRPVTVTAPPASRVIDSTDLN